MQPAPWSRMRLRQLFDVKVVRVNIINAAAKRGRRAKSRRLLVRRPGYKKAIDHPGCR